MWRHAGRYGLLAYWSLSETVLRLIGRRPAYGVLTIDLGGDLPEAPGAYRLLDLSPRSGDNYYNVLAVLRWARTDPQLRAVLVRCSELHVGWARVQELRRALKALGDAGKPVWF